MALWRSLLLPASVVLIRRHMVDSGEQGLLSSAV